MLGPNITGKFSGGQYKVASGATSQHTTNAAAFTSHSASFTMENYDFNASESNAIYTDSGKVFPLSLHLNYIVKC